MSQFDGILRMLRSGNDLRTQGWNDAVREIAAAEAMNVGLSHDDLCRLSRLFNVCARLDYQQDARINEWLKTTIGAALLNPDTPPQPPTSANAEPAGAKHRRQVAGRDMAISVLSRLIANYESQRDQIADSDLDREQPISITFRGQLGDIRNARSAVGILRNMPTAPQLSAAINKAMLEALDALRLVADLTISDSIGMEVPEDTLSNCAKVFAAFLPPPNPQ